MLFNTLENGFADLNLINGHWWIRVLNKPLLKYQKHQKASREKKNHCGECNLSQN